MTQDKRPADRSDLRPALKTCPWCGGTLNFDGRYPVTRLAAGESRLVRDDDIPALLRLVPAWVCATPLCRYREPA